MLLYNSELVWFNEALKAVFTNCLELREIPDNSFVVTASGKRGLCLVYLAALGSAMSPNSAPVSKPASFVPFSRFLTFRQGECVLRDSLILVFYMYQQATLCFLYVVAVFQFCFVPIIGRFAGRDAFFVCHCSGEEKVLAYKDDGHFSWNANGRFLWKELNHICRGKRCDL